MFTVVLDGLRFATALEVVERNSSDRRGRLVQNPAAELDHLVVGHINSVVEVAERAADPNMRPRCETTQARLAH